MKFHKSLLAKPKTTMHKYLMLTILLFTIGYSSLLYSQDYDLRFFEMLIEKGFFELTNEWINEKLQEPIDTEYKSQLEILLNTIKYKKLYLLPPEPQLKESLSLFNSMYNNEISKICNNEKTLSESNIRKLEDFLIKFIDFLNYYDSYLKNAAKDNLKLQNDLIELAQNTLSSLEKVIKKDDLETEIEQKFKFYLLVLKFLHFKLTTAANDPKINNKVSSLEKEFDNYYLEAQPSISAYEISLLKCKIYKMVLENKIANNENKGIASLLDKINAVVEEIDSKRENIGNKKEFNPLNALIIKTVLFKLDIATLQFKHNLPVKDKNLLYNKSMSDIDFISSFPYQWLKLEALFRKAQIFEYTGNIKDALPLYLTVAKSTSNLSRSAQEILRQYQYNTTLSSDTEIFQELAKLINNGDTKKIWNFYTLYAKKRKFFSHKYIRTLQEIITTFFTTNNQYLESSILNYYLFKTLPANEKNNKQKEIRLSNAILSLQDYISAYKEEEFFGELLNSMKTEFTSNFPDSATTQSILLKDIKAKIQGKNIKEAIELIKQTQWVSNYEKEANILKKYLEIKMLNKVTKTHVIEFIQTIKSNAKNDLYLNSLSLALFIHISFEKKQYKLAYRFLKNLLPILSENKEVYIGALENAIKASYHCRKYKDFERWTKEYLQIATIPADPIIELLKNYAIICTAKYKRNKALEFLNMFTIAMKKNRKYTLQNDISERILLINTLYKASEYSTNLIDAPSSIVAEKICNNIEKEDNKTIEKYLVSWKIISKEKIENKFEKLKLIESYKLLLQSQCLALKFRYSHNKNILEEMQKLTEKNKDTTTYKTLAKDTALAHFIALKKNLYDKKELELIYKTYSALLKDIFTRKYVRKDKPDKFSKEIILLSIYSSVYTRQQIEKTKSVIEKYKTLLAMPDTKKLFKLVYEELPQSK